MVKAYGNLRRTLGFLIIILSITTVLAVYAQGDADSTDDFPEYGNIVIPVSVSVRRAASTESDVVGELRRGQFIQALNINSTQQWVFIERTGLIGWVKRDLVRWHDDIDSLPVRPSFAPLPTIAPEVLSATPFVPTATQSVSFVRLEYQTSAIIRSGPSRTYPIVDIFPPNYSIEYPIGRDENTNWVLLQYTDETTDEKKFGWISVILVEWLIDLDALPILSDDNLTPTITVTPSKTHTITPIPSHTNTSTPSQTPSHTPSPTNTSTPSHTPSPTNSSTPSQTPTHTPSPTSTSTPSSTPTHTPSPTNTSTPSSTPSHTPSPTNTSTPTHTPSPTNTSTPTHTPSPTNSSTPSQTPTIVVQAADTNAPTPTQLSVNDVPDVSPSATNETANLPIEAIVAGIVSAVILLYVALYWNGITSVERYKDGFVIKDCPVCNSGQLQVETKQYRIFGIPRGKHTVRCDNCRSVLRATGKQRWRYAVDRMENSDLYDRYNNKHIMTSEIANLLTKKRSKSTHTTVPKFVDDSDDKS
jgi:hypothetical protein